MCPEPLAAPRSRGLRGGVARHAFEIRENLYFISMPPPLDAKLRFPPGRSSFAFGGPPVLCE